MRAVRDEILDPTRFRARGREILPLRHVPQQRMRTVATRIDDADSDSRPAEAAAGRVDPHQALTPALQSRGRKVGKELAQGSQPDGVDTGAQARRRDDTIPMIGSRPDEQYLHRLDRSSEEGNSRRSGFVRQGLSGQSASVDDDCSFGERLIAFANNPNRNLGRN